MLNWDEIEVGRTYTVDTIYELKPPKSRRVEGVTTMYALVNGPKRQVRICEFVKERDFRCTAIVAHDHPAFRGIFPPVPPDFAPLRKRGLRGMDDARFEELQRDVEAAGFPIKYAKRTATRATFCLKNDRRSEEELRKALDAVAGKYGNPPYDFATDLYRDALIFIAKD